MGNFFIHVYFIRMRWLTLYINFLAIGLCLLVPAWTQNYTQLCTEADILFPDVDKVILAKNYFVEVKLEDDTIELISTNKEITYIRKNADFNSKESIYYSSEFNKLKEVAAYTYNLNTRKRTKFAGYSTGMYHNSNIFYDDNREAYFYYPDLVDNSVTELEYKIHYTDPHLLPVYYFAFSDPVLSSKLTISVPKGCEIGYILKDHGKYEVDVQQETRKDLTLYTWELKNIRIDSKRTEGVPASSTFPHVIFWIKKYSTTNGEKEVLSGINDLYAWYREFLKHAETKDEMMVKNISDSITKNLSTDFAKASAIYDWVQGNISYVAMEDGYSGFIPRTADAVIRKKYGDCKDMANLLVKLMEYANLDGRHVWIGTRDILYTYQEVYTPIVDNHMIAAVKIGEEYYFMDATGKYMPLGFPTSFIQGKVGLVEERDSFLLMEVKVVDKNKNMIKDSISIQVMDNKISSNGLLRIEGYPLIDIKHELSYAKNISENNYFKKLLIKGNNKFKLLNYHVDMATQQPNDMTINYEFELNDYVLSSQNELYINLNISKTDISSIDEKVGSNPIISTNDYNYIKEDIFSLSIPAGYKVRFIPTNYTVEKEYLQYYSSYEAVGNQLVLTRKLVLDYLNLDQKYLLEYNNLVDEIQKTERSNVSLIIIE